MQIIVLNIPPSTSLQELRRFIRRGLFGPLAFWRDDGLISCDIIDIQDTAQGVEESHGLVSLADPDAARRIIQRLDGRRFKGQPVQVREFHNRTPGDQRINQLLADVESPPENRREGLKLKRRIGLQKKKKRPSFFKLYDQRKSAPFTPREDDEG
ncbi:MAG: RNA-binding protein [Gammaproteobacteria bacterium SHHR-1]|uniref:RNA recognition motif domain-containing protein n=1 Tax=Magnetovirga frankeli TaxID=947516 RepID=UPI0012939A3C|nr:RNA-binding protein [gamma proteobacterium SS-5]